jgi:hypothetical protein
MCASKLCGATKRSQAEAVQELEQQLLAVDVDDLPALVRFLASNATPASAHSIAATLRGCLHCAAPSDPRLAVPDQKQKGPAGGRGRVAAEARVLRELAAALQGCEAAGGGFLAAIAADQGAQPPLAGGMVLKARPDVARRALCVLTLPAQIAALLEPSPAEPRLHRPLDFWVLLLLWQQGGMPSAGGAAAGVGAQRARAAEQCLRRKLLEGHAGTRWIEGAVRDHGVRLHSRVFLCCVIHWGLALA